MLNQQKLARILEMLTSSHDGEVVNAARLATKLLEEAGLTWTEVAARVAVKVDRTATEATPRYEAAPKAQRPTPQRRDYGRKAAQPPPPRSQKHQGIDAGDLARYLLARPERMTQWERDFVASLLLGGVRHPKLTEGQWKKLWEIGVQRGAIEEDDAA